MGAWLRHRLPDRVDVAGMLAAGRFVDDAGRPVADDAPYAPHTFVWFHRDLRDEPEVPGAIHVVHRDERVVVVDKPPFLSSIPRGNHVRQSVVVRLREELGLPELSPLHRLDRVTSGLLMLATERRWRGPYQSMFQDGRVRKTYRALAPYRADLDLPVTVANHLQKRRGTWQAEVVPDAPVNAETLVELEARVSDDLAVYRLTPRQSIKIICLFLSIWRPPRSPQGMSPPASDVNKRQPLCPTVRDVAVDDFREPLQLLAAALAFTDPVDGTERRFDSVRTLPLASEA